MISDTVNKVAASEFDNPFNNKKILEYYHGCYRRFAPLNSFNAVPDGHAPLDHHRQRMVLLQDVFVVPALSDEYFDAERISLAEEGKVASLSLFNIPSLLNKFHHMVILGDPGMGKSLLVQWMLLAFIQSDSYTIRNQAGVLIPFVIKLRELSLDAIDGSWDTFWQACLTFNRLPDNCDWCEGVLRNGKAIFLIDGLDEICDVDQRGTLINSIREGIKKHQACRFIITSRIIGFDYNQWKDQAHEVAEFFLVPFDSRRQRRFIQAWLRQYIQDKTRENTMTNDLMDCLREHQALQQLARIPSLLNLICFIYLRRAGLPNGHAELFERIDEIYLVSLDQARSIKFRNHQLPLDYKDMQNILAKVALVMQKQKKPLISQENVMNVFYSYIQNRTNASESSCEQEGLFFLDYIAQRSGLFIPRGMVEAKTNYAFSHRSFQEYFAARELASTIFRNKSQQDLLRDSFPLDAWRYVFIIMFELFTHPDDADDCASKLFDDTFIDPLLKNNPYCGCLFSEIIMNKAIRFSTKERMRYIKKSWLAFKNYSLTKPDQDVYEWKRSERLWLKTLWSKNFDAIKIFKDVFKKEEGLALTGYWVDSLDPLLDLGDALKKLNISATGISDFTELVKLKQLTSLNLCNTKIHDLSFLKVLDQLEELNIWGSNITSLEDAPSQRDKKLKIIMNDRQKESFKKIPKYMQYASFDG